MWCVELLTGCGQAAVYVVCGVADWLRTGSDRNSTSFGNKTQHILGQNSRSVKLTPKYAAHFVQ
jgi:hypothetical protein